jgi:hypothetical protein
VEDREPHDRVKAARTLKSWADEGHLLIFHGAFDEPLVKSNGAKEYEGIRTDSNLTRLGEWTLGVSVLASRQESLLDQRIHDLLVGPGVERPEKPTNLDRDRYLLTTHAHFGHDIFVTGDENHILKHREQLKGWGIIVMSPREAVDYLQPILFTS